MNPDIDKMAQRTRRYWYEDGLVEIAAGGVFLWGTTVILVSAAIAAVLGAPAALVVAAGLIFLTTVGAMTVAKGVRRAVNAVKNRVTYPRTGYVAYRAPKAIKRSPAGMIGLAILTVAGSVIVAAGLGVLARRLPDWALSMPVSEGVLFGLLLALLGYRLGLARFYVLAALSALVGAGVALTTDPYNLLSAAVYFGAMGIVLIGSGGLALRDYLRQNPLPADGDADEYEEV
ncbi:MAG: hypothetical protein JXB47_17265 [Anaerolineae bacterium]|nr:hypothetical protein [Anaerolineae bacterium]